MTDRSERLIKIIFVILLIPSLILLVWVMLRLNPVTLSYINALTQFLLVALGATTVAREAWPQKHPVWFVGAFVIVGAIGMFAAIRQGQQSAWETQEAQRQAAEANLKLSNSIENLNKGAAEIARVQGQNAELQQRLLDSSGEILNQGKIISGLSRQSIEITTGGESFCHMSLMGDPDNHRIMIPVFLHVGKNPLYEVQVRIVNFQLVDPLARQKPLPIDQIMATDKHVSLGELIPESAWIDRQQVIDFNGDKAERQDYRIFFTARNGYWSQDLIWQKTDKGWATATRVFRDKGKNRRLIFTKIDKGFPRSKLKWHS